MAGWVAQIADDDAALGPEMSGRLAERRDPPVGIGDEIVTATREDDHVEAVGQGDVLKKSLDDVGPATAHAGVTPRRGDRAARRLERGHAVSLRDKWDEIAAGPGPDEQHMVVVVDES